MDDRRGVTVLFVLLIMTTASFNQYCSLSRRTVEVVSSCPKTKEETIQSAKTKKCFALADVQKCTEPEKFKYHCLPNHEQSELVEVCAPEVDVYGICVAYNIEKGKLHNNTNMTCSNHMQSCPSPYPSTLSHLYTSCQKGIDEISTVSRIFEVTSPSPDNPWNEMLLILSIVTGILIIFIIFIALSTAIFCKIRHNRKNLENENEALLSEVSAHCTNLHHEVGDYNLWKTKVSDQFSTLTDDEVCVLYCFLCSDSGSPDFTDTEFMDMLNEIRQRVYRKKEPITSEEALQTLDRLKSLDILWEDHDKMPEDTKHETMYKIASINRVVPFIYSSYDTASVYLRSSGYRRKPGEKCVLSNHTASDSLYIQRLQMNILTHVTMEDTRFHNKLSQMLNIPKAISVGNQSERERFLGYQEQQEGDIYYRGRANDSVQHVTWLWRHELSARPDIVRSCIGLYPHWDIYIINNKPYRKRSYYHEYPPDIRCLLYSFLLVDEYTVPINDDSHKTTLNKIRDRYFEKNAMFNGINNADLPEGILQREDNTIMFTSDDIRHDVMYAFVTECLVEEGDLEFFLTIASGQVISEYCRTWGYKRREGERCLYVPEWPDLLEPVIDRLQLDIITHCPIFDENIRYKISRHLDVPEEILSWDKAARKRYAKYAKRGTQTVHHSSEMIVGFAASGNTTLLKRLVWSSEEKTRNVKSTEGQDVDKEVFKIDEETKTFKGGELPSDEDLSSSLPEAYKETADVDVYLKEKIHEEANLEMPRHTQKKLFNTDNPSLPKMLKDFRTFLFTRKLEKEVILDDFRGCQIIYPAYKHVKTRELSFASCKDKSIKDRAWDFARNGFFYEGYDLVTTCFHCGITKDDWEEDDDIQAKHKTLNEACEFVKYLQLTFLKTK